MRTLFLFVLLSISIQTPSYLRAETIGLIVPTHMTEPFLGDYSNAQLKSWYGVYCAQRSCHIKPTKLKVRVLRVQDCDGKPVEASYISYKPEKPIFLIDRKLSNTSEIAEAEHRPSEGYNISNIARTSNGVIWPLKYRGIAYKVRFPEAYVSESECKPGELPIEVFNTKNLESTWKRNICRFEALDIPGDFSIEWAGDLDNDRKLDMLVRLPQGPFILLLSSMPNVRSQHSWKFPNKPAC